MAVGGVYRCVYGLEDALSVGAHLDGPTTWLRWRERDVLYVECRSRYLYLWRTFQEAYVRSVSFSLMMMIDMLIFVKSVCIVLYYSEAFTRQL